MSANGKMTGTVKFFIQLKGYGFIGRAAERDVFVHVKDLPGGVQTLPPETRVAFRIEDRPQGPRAREVEILSYPPGYTPSAPMY